MPFLDVLLIVSIGHDYCKKTITKKAKQTKKKRKFNFQLASTLILPNHGLYELFATSRIKKKSATTNMFELN